LRAESAVVWDIKVDTGETRWPVIKTTLQNICECVLGHVTSERKPWIRVQSWEKIEKRRGLKAKASLIRILK
jgi:hypothetical protein